VQAPALHERPPPRHDAPRDVHEGSGGCEAGGGGGGGFGNEGSCEGGGGSSAAGGVSVGGVCVQGLTLVHFSAQLERFVWDGGCA